MTETIPLKLTLRHSGHSAGLLEEVQRGSDRLAELRARVSRCDVLLESPSHHHRHGSQWRARIDLTIPGKEILVDHALAEDPYSAVHQAFAIAAQKIESFRQRRLERRGGTGD